MDGRMKELSEWSMGSGQCPECHGCKPDAGWWTDTIGHKIQCGLADLMFRAGEYPIYEHANPERSVGSYIPNRDSSGNGLIATIRYNDPEKDRKLKLAAEQDVWGIRKAVESLVFHENQHE